MLSTANMLERKSLFGTIQAALRPIYETIGATESFSNERSPSKIKGRVQNSIEMMTSLPVMLLEESALYA